MGSVQPTTVFTTSGGAYGVGSLYNRYSDTYFVGWGEYEP